MAYFAELKSYLDGLVNNAGINHRQTYDDFVAADMLETFDESDQDMRALVKTIVVSDSFRFRRVDDLSASQQDPEEL